MSTTYITADWPTLMRQAWMTAADYMDNAVREDRCEVRSRVCGEKPRPGRGLYAGCGIGLPCSGGRGRRAAYRRRN